jgi:hypothetical protein
MFVNNNGVISGQKIYKFFLFHREESMDSYGCKWSLLKVREGNYKGGMMGPGGICRQRGHLSLLQVLLKLMLTSGKGRT